MKPASLRLPALCGGLLALMAAALFGASTPVIQLLGAGIGPLTTVALLYSGAAFAGALLRRRADREARVTASDLPRLLAVAGFGAVIGPVALAWGLQPTSGASTSLMLALGAVFTALLAWWIYRESIGRRIGAALALIFAGAVV